MKLKTSEASEAIIGKARYINLYSSIQTQQ